MRLSRTLGVCFLLLNVSGCTYLSHGGGLQLAADPLEKAADAQGSNNLEKVHDLVQDSQTKCEAFVVDMFKRTAETNTGLDILGTITSSLATVFTPLTTVHALTAASTITGGAKTAISTEFLNGVTISHITQAIQSTYSVDMKNYINYLNTVTDPNGIDVVGARSTIQSYHAECALPAADGSIASALQPSSPPQSTQLTLTYTVTATDKTAANVASHILAQLNGDANFKAAGVTAAEDKNPPNGTIKISIPANSTATWKTPTTSTGAIEHPNLAVGPPAVLTITLTTGTIPKSGDTITLSVTINQVAGGPTPPQATPAPPQSTQLTLTYKVTDNDQTTTDIATSILNQLNKDANFKSAGITAVQNTSPPNGTIKLNIPAN